MSKILIIEDERSLNEAYQMVLKRAKHKVFAAYNGQEALDNFANQNPDLVLLDLRMPKMDGIEFLENLRPDKNYPETHVIVFSNYDDPAEIDKAFKLGATRYLLKAWSSPKDLVKIVNRTLAENPNKPKATAR